MRISTYVVAVLMLSTRLCSADTWYSDADGDLVRVGKAVAAKARPASVSSSVSYSYRMRWNISGDWSPSDRKIADHLRSDHGVDVSGMSRAQMLATHDAIHDAEEGRKTSSYSSGSSCPPGGCPAPGRKGRRR